MLVRPSDSSMASPEPVSAPFAALVAQFASHPGADWVRTQYRRHRGAPLDFDGPGAGAG